MLCMKVSPYVMASKDERKIAGSAFGNIEWLHAKKCNKPDLGLLCDDMWQQQIHDSKLRPQVDMKAGPRCDKQDG